MDKERAIKSFAFDLPFDSISFPPFVFNLTPSYIRILFAVISGNRGNTTLQIIYYIFSAEMPIRNSLSINEFRMVKIDGNKRDENDYLI